MLPGSPWLLSSVANVFQVQSVRAINGLPRGVDKETEHEVYKNEPCSLLT